MMWAITFKISIQSFKCVAYTQIKAIFVLFSVHIMRISSVQVCELLWIIGDQERGLIPEQRPVVISNRAYILTVMNCYFQTKIFTGSTNR